ncbi:MAG: VCBS repeat-containing protein [Gemmataceae bacterium]
MTSFDGVHTISRDKDKWTTTKIGEGNQANPKASRGASEIKRSAGKLDVIATVEPWHGNQIVTYTPPSEKGKLWDRHVVDEQLRWGHGVWFADLDGDGVDELIIGVRRPEREGRRQVRGARGVRLYKSTARAREVGAVHPRRRRRGGRRLVRCGPRRRRQDRNHRGWPRHGQRPHLLEPG